MVMGLLKIPTPALREEDPMVSRMAESLPAIPEDESWGWV